MSDTDLQLLARYARNHAEEAFTELVRRHVDLVYSAALRQVRSPQLAEEVAQSAFTVLAREAHRLPSDTILTAWLYQVTRHIAIDVVRREARRQLREQTAAEMNALNGISHFAKCDTEDNWKHIEPDLDDAMSALDDTDRAAVLLRYFENKSLREVGQQLGVSDDAAQKRVSRAVDRLRDFFAKRGVTVGAGGLVVVIAANAVQAAPVGLAVTISTAAALAGTTLATTATATATKAIAMTTLQKAIVTATVAVLAGAGIYEARQISNLRDRVETLQQEQAALAEDARQLQSERDYATNQLAALRNENDRLSRNTAELFKLRGEVPALRNEANDPDHKAFKELANRVKSLRQLVEQRPDKQIPELQFLTDKVWADVAWNADLDTEDGIRLALSNLRGEAENIFLNEMLHNALKKYLTANNNLLPASLLDLKPFFNVPVTDAMLSRYELLQSGKPDPQADLVKLSSYTDEDYDSFHTIALNGASGGGFNRNQDAINDAAREFARLNNYQSPTNPAQIAPFLSRTIDSATIQKYLNQFVLDQPSPDEIIMAPALHAYFMAHNGARPNKAADLLPYITTPEQQAAYQRLESNSK